MDELARGHAIVLADDLAGGLGVLVFAAEKTVTGAMTFVVEHSSGLVCVALPTARCAQLRLPPMCPPEDRSAPDYCVTFDAAEGTTTGISARDRARGARLLADPTTTPEDRVRPGHLIPLRAADGRVLERVGRAEAAVRLTELAGLAPAAVLAEVVSPADPTRLCEGTETAAFAAAHGLVCVSLTDVVEYELAALDEPVPTARMRGPS
ncbi:3,4-dihydroxy-2-butanone-4-phosphate synthase [Amycolatopsis sp. DSM 110486]|uniref:3,4-dihydroxy-2-butanone-4-phosphate synthase n=1 Tax=Amycolatopsis sp. DSM 110486 TaxID=2865832 RepID=UPI0021077778|nr:3,4-dihydroxy-2-butanone-4-phosphate synthase [Amycolatopsis sp. DSM 110486]